MNKPLPTLSIRQPWAWLIVHGYKDIENRKWRYPPKHRGPFLIHAAAGMSRSEYQDCAALCQEISVNTGKEIPLPAFDDLQRGGIVGITNMIGVANHSPSPWFFQEPGNMGFILKDSRPLPFMPCKGQLGFYNTEYTGLDDIHQK